MQFEGDEAKARSNIARHGVSFDVAITIFGDPLSETAHDPRHSEGEDRFVTIGFSSERGVVVVMHTDRGDAVRIIGARRATARERKQYEQGV